MKRIYRKPSIFGNFIRQFLRDNALIPALQEETVMDTAIVYYSKHHGNTKKLLDAIATAEEVTLIDVTAAASTDLTSFDRIGFASGIYYSSFAKQIL